jgi:hypothetical protein
MHASGTEKAAPDDAGRQNPTRHRRHPTNDDVAVTDMEVIPWPHGDSGRCLALASRRRPEPSLSVTDRSEQQDVDDDDQDQAELELRLRS